MQALKALSARSRPAAAALLALGAVLLAGRLGAQEVAEPAPASFGETLEVRVVNIEVVVTDRAGERVPGLGPDDFVLYVNGEEQPIEYFTEILGGTAVAPGSADGPASIPAVSPGSPVGTSYLVFIDDFFSIQTDRNRVLRQLSEDLPFLGPEDRMAVVAYDGRRVEMLSSWTSDAGALEDVFRTAQDRRANGLQRLAERRRFDYDRVLQAVLDFRDETLGPNTLQSYLNPEERYYAGLLTDQVERSVNAASASLRGFASPPGRKVLLLLSGGWPFLPAEFVVADINRPLVERSYLSGGELMTPLVETANQLGYTIYPADVPGLDRSGPDASVAAPPVPGTLDRSSFLREQEVHASLWFIAEQTGGQALINGDRSKVFERAVEDTRSYYWLGFSPQWERTDSERDIRVEVRDPSLRVRSRGGFTDFSRETQTTMAVESALLFGNPPSLDPLALAFGRPEKAGRGKMLVPVTVGIPVDRLTLLPEQGLYVADLELRIAIVDSRGVQAEVPVIPLRLQYEAEPAAGYVAEYQTSLKMRREQHAAVISIYDRLSGRMLSGTAEIGPSRGR